MKTIWLDTETTGADPVRNDIWQLAYILIDNGKEVHRNTLECKPWCPWTADPAALAIGIMTNGKPVSEIAQINYEGFTAPWHAISRFKADLQRYIEKYDKHDKAAVGGYNVIFDLNMLSWWFKKNSEKYGLGTYTDYTILDAAPMMRMMKSLGYIEIENTKLSTVCKYYDITLDNAHNAMVDVEASMQVYPCALNDFRDMLNQEQYFGQLTAGEIL